MNANEARLYRRIREFEFDAPGTERTFAARLAEENGWTPEFARRAIEEYRRFVFTYVYGGREWSLEVPALSLEEAKERVRVLPFARCEGEAVRAERPPPRTHWFARSG